MRVNRHLKKHIPFKHSFKVIRLLAPRERRSFLLVLGASLLMGIIEIAGVGSIMPFIAVAANPETIFTTPPLKAAYEFFGFTGTRWFLAALGALMLAFVILRNAFSAFLMYIKVRFVQRCRHTLSTRLFTAYLGQKYSFFLGKNSYEFSKNIISEVTNVISGTITPMTELATYGIQILLLIVFLFTVDVASTAAIAAIILIIYSGIVFSTKRKLSKLGLERFNLMTLLSRSTNEVFWGIKAAKISGTERVFLNTYMPNSRKFSKNTAAEEVIGTLPKYVLEAAGFSAIILFILFLTLRAEGNFSRVISSISLYAYAGYRLLPSVQQYFRSLTKLKYSAPATEKIIAEFSLEKEARALPDLDIAPMPFERSIALEHVSFTYPNKSDPVLKDISLSIPKNSIAGFCGQTGSGKTTTIDVILGLLVPQRGQLLIDGVPVTDENRNAWQKNIGYVPQSVYLSNTTILENIAFGIPREQIDRDAVIAAARMAQLHDFITEELADGYETNVGERGVCLSGGQQQRIGIARALYHNPPVLVLDEATSALDGQTESDVMEAIDQLAGKKTILIIAHRITTLKQCAVIYEINGGRITKQGTYSELFPGM